MRLLFILFGLLSVSSQAAIERSTDGGQTWKSISQTSPGHFSGFERVSASGAECADSVIPDTADSSSLQQQRRVPFANPGSNSTQQTFLRFINPNATATDVEVYGIDDDGTANKSGAISFTLAAESSLQFTAQDMENGNNSKGLTGSFCDGEGKWQLIVRSDNSIEVMSLIRAPGGFLTSLNEVVPTSGNDYLVYFVNKASEPEQQTFLRILNRSDQSGSVTISAIDDAGNPGASDITLNLTANDSQQMTSQDLENGNTDKGLTGALGDGEGNWRLTITSTLELDVMSLIRLPGGYLTNLSAVAPGTGNTRELHLVEPADETLRTSSVRVVNTSNNVATITIAAVDDAGAVAPGGDVIFSLNPNAAREIPISDLESGASDLSGMLGNGEGRWRMTVSSDNSIEVMSLVETEDGFLTNLSRAVPTASNVHEVLVFNPASNIERRSKLRIVNDGVSQAAITISGFDDAGEPGDSDVTLNLSAGESIEISAVDLESGNAELGLVGALGDGTGKWRLTVTSSSQIQVQGMLDTPEGFITNLSRATEGETTEPLPTPESQSFFNENVSPTIQSQCIACHVVNGVAGSTALIYQSSSASGYLENNYNVLSNYVNANDSNGQILLDKARGVGHGGGTQLTTNSEGYQNLETFVELLGSETASSGFDGEFWEGVTMATPEQTIRRASMILRGTPPSDSELLAVQSGTDAAMRSTIRNMMEGDAFHEFVTRGANDRLLTDTFLDGFFDVADPNSAFFPDLANRNYDTNLEDPDDNHWLVEWFWGIARSPVELIAYVVENDRNYQEVVTADYMMVNHMTNDLLNAGATFNTDDPSVFLPGENNGQILVDDQFQGEFVNNAGSVVTSHSGYIEYPHAGVLNTHAYLNRYPSTETNRNRARARWTYYHFLGVDIEKSAERTTDPDALADTNNPTMNNSACTVCHQLLDPVAGTFQNYGNEGWYRDQYGGNDSLPDTYKYPEWFAEDAEPSEYQEGDTWYRDMRDPGFDNETAPNAANSLQWMGQQIAEDERFATAAIKFWWPAIMGAEALVAPASSDDPDFETRLAAFETQDEFITALGIEFSSGIAGGSAYNGKDLFAEIMISPWFRAEAVSDSEVRERLVSELGTDRLLTPEELEKKSTSLLGWTWGASLSEYSFDGTYTRLVDQYGIYYGGIDSDGITERSTGLTSLMANVAEKQALEMACPAVVLDFYRTSAERLLFADVEPSLTPATETQSEVIVDAESYEERENYIVQGSFSAGPKTVAITFLNDFYDEEIGDRNMFVESITINAPSGAELAHFELTSIDSIAGASYNCGNPNERGFSFWGSCTATLPFTTTETGNHTITVRAFGQQAGPDLVNMEVAINDTDPAAGNSAGALAIKEKLVELHDQFLGESLTTEDVEIEASYQLLTETWQARLVTMEEAGTWAWSWPDEGCNFYLNEHWDEGGPGSTANDPTGMMNTWTSMIIYLMTDFAYLHE